MKKFVPLLVIIAAFAGVLMALLPPRNPGEFDIVGFGRLPVLANGRIKPLDTVARSSLLQIEHHQTVPGATPNSRPLRAIEWLLDVCFRSDVADAYQIFKISHPDVLTLFDLKSTDGRNGDNYFSFNQLGRKLEELERQARLAGDVDAGARSSFQRAVLQLYNDVLLYQQLKHAFVMPGRDDFLGDLLKFQEKLGAGRAAVIAKEAGKPHDEAAVNAMLQAGEMFGVMEKASLFLVIPPDAGSTDQNGWRNAGAALLDTFRTGQVNPAALAYAGFAHAWRKQQPKEFNELLRLYRNDLEKRFGPQLAKASAEARFNAIDPFTLSFTFYALALFAAMFSWLVWPDALGRSAFWLVGLAWILATAGIATRMWLEGRPPVTNLYSSALFVGWGAVLLCLGLEYFYRNAIGSAAAGLIGFGTLMIADRLSMSGDTLEMMRAVLDSNFWLATHVVVVASGYSATCLAGFLALIYVVRGVFTRSLDKATADSLARMVYGIVCFATLFSFTGTVLGGIWADQSWGRFWGWDPKENGALMIVIWNAIILHARWGGMIKQRGLMCLAIFGNVIFSWSWFGTNMLGVGLHSYGFTDAAFWWLSAFIVSQLVMIGIANLPLEKWRSFQPAMKAAAPEHVEVFAK